MPLQNRTWKDDCYTNLAIAITRQAAEDYAKAYREYQETGRKRRECRELERWFKSSRGQIISFGKGELIMQRIRNGEPMLEYGGGVEHEQTDI